MQIRFPFFLIFFITSFVFSQTTLFSETFDSTSISSSSLNTLGYSDHNAVSWTSETLYFHNNSTDSDCTSAADWTEASSQDTYYGTAPSGMSGYRAGIKSQYQCEHNQNLITKRWTSGQSTMTVSFSYSYRHYSGGSFTVYLQSRPGAGSFSNHSTLVYKTSSASVDYSSTINVTNGHEYRLVFRFIDDWGYGAAVDTILVTESAPSPTISVGSAITNLNYASGSGPSASQTTTVSGSNLEADITLTAPTNFEISTNNSSFADSQTLSHSGGTVNSTTIYARLKTGLSNNSYSGNLTASSTNATSQIISLSGQISSTTLYVDDSGSDSNDGLSSSSPFETLSQAISSAASGIGVTINIGAGSYNEHTLNLNKSSITIQGAGSTTIFANTTSNKHMMTISASNSTISKMTVKDYGFTTGGSNAYGGGAIRVGATPGNSTTSTTLFGILFEDILFKDNTTNSTSADGGAIEFTAHSSSSTTTTATIKGCTFDGNRAGTNSSSTAGHNGAAVMGKEGARITINNSLFFDNKVDYAGTVTIWDATYDAATVTLNNCTFYDNISYSSTAGYIAGGVFAWGGTATINNSIFWDSDATNSDSFDIDGLYSVININYSLIEDYSTTNTSGTVNPDSYTSTNEGTNPSFTDVSSDDYSLQSGSIAIDAGSSSYAPVDDINDFSRPQGQSDDLGAYEHRNTWDGSTDTDWSTAANWSEDIVPVAGRSPIIADVVNQPVISSDDGSSGDVSLEDITINSGAELTINKEASLTLTDDFTNNSGSVYLESDSNEFASIIVQGDASGNITYKRFVNYASDGEWDLIGSPVDGLDINTFVSTNTSGTATLASNGVQYALGVYDNSNNDWSNYTSDGSGAGNVNAAGNFDIGKGYQIASVQGGTQILEFTGTIATSDQLQSVINNHASSGRRWNLVANPFPSYLKLNDDADGTNNFLTVNNSNSVIDSAFLAAYGWDADGTGWTPRGQDFNSDTAVYVAPGQAFMIAANSASAANLSFTESMQTSIGSDDFIQGDVLETKQIILKLFDQDDSLIKNTHVKFRENMTEGLDPGYDLGCYNQDDALSTRLLEGDNGINFEYQQLPLSIMNNAVIPLVINRLGGEEFRISLFTSTVENQEIFLEDTLLGTFTNLLQDDYSLLAQQDIEGVGRFFIHMSSETMSSDDLDKNFLSIYKENDLPYITLEGLLHNVNNAKFRLYDIFGKLVINLSLESSSNTQKISTVGLSSGIYIAEVESGINKLIKKILIQ